MIFTTGYYESTNLPKYLEKVVEMMRKAKNVVFNNKEELKLFADRARKQLDKDKPANSEAYVEFYYANDGGGCVYVRKKHNAACSDAIRFMFEPLNGAYDYDEETRSFFRVNFDNVRIKDVFQEGGRL